MAEPNLATVLYVIPSEHLQVVLEDAVTPRLGQTTGDNRVDALIAALRIGRPVQAMTTLQNGDVLFALGIFVK